MITVVGTGPGSPEYLAPIGQKAIAAAEIIAGGAAWLDRLAGHPADKIDIHPIDRFIERLKKEGNAKRIVVLVSGDPGLFSLLHVIKREAPALRLEVVPGISAAQVLFARLALDWSEVDFVSLHGRPIDTLAGLLDHGAKLCVFTDAVNTPAKVGLAVLARGFAGRAVVGEDLTGPRETVTKLSLVELAEFNVTRTRPKAPDAAALLALVYLEID